MMVRVKAKWFAMILKKVDDLGKIDGDAMKCFRTTSVLRKWVSCLSLLPMIAPFCPKSKHWHVSDSCNLRTVGTACVSVVAQRSPHLSQSKSIEPRRVCTLLLLLVTHTDMVEAFYNCIPAIQCEHCS